MAKSKIATRLSKKKKNTPLGKKGAKKPVKKSKKKTVNKPTTKRSTKKVASFDILPNLVSRKEYDYDNDDEPLDSLMIQLPKKRGAKKSEQPIKEVDSKLDGGLCKFSLRSIGSLINMKTHLYFYRRDCNILI